MEKDLDTSFEIVPQQQASASDNIPSVYVPEYDITVKTDIDDSFLIRYLAGRKGRNIPRENFFGMEDMKSSQGELANGIISQAARGMAGTAASFAMTTYRAAKGFGDSLENLFERDARLAKLNKDKSLELERLKKRLELNIISKEEYARREQELRADAPEFLKKQKAIHDKFLAAEEAANREMERLKKANEEWLKRAGLAKTGRDGFVYDLAAGTMSLAFAVGATMAFKSPAAGGALFGLITGREDYEEAIENGKSRETAAYLGLAGGSASWFLESLGVDNIFRTLKNAGLLKHFAKGAIGEFAEEFGQNIADDAIMIKYGGRKKTTQQIVEDAIAAGVIGGITGGFFGGTIGYYNDYQQTKAELSQLAQNIKFKQAEETLQKISETEPTKLPYVDDKGNIIDENGNIAGKAEPEEAPEKTEAKAQAKRNVAPEYLNWVYQDTVNKLMENGLDREAAENLAGRAMGKAADIVSTVIPQMIDHELNEATLEGQADEIAAQLRETIQNLGKKRPLKKAFRQEIEQIYNEEIEKGKEQGLKAEEAEFYAKIQATRIMWDSTYTGLSPKFIAEQAAIELRNKRAEAAQQRELPGTYIHKEEDGTYSLKGRYYAGSYYKSGRIKENRGWEDVEETGTIFEGFKTEEEARAFASRLAEMQEDLPGSGGAKAERAGLPRRPKNSQAGKGLLKMLGFKDVKTGRELTKGEEKPLASAAYDGIYDLAEILNIPPESLALNGTLTIKLGAPKTDIKPGEGAKYRAKDKTIIMDAEAGSGRFAAAWYAAFTDYMKSPEIRPEMKAAFEKLQKAINSRKLTAEEIQREQEKSLKEAEKGLKEANDAIDNSEVSFGLYDLADEVMATHRIIDAHYQIPSILEDSQDEMFYGEDSRILSEAYKKTGDAGVLLMADLINAHNNIIAVESMDFSTDLSRFAADYSAATGKTTADSKETSASETELESAAFASYIYNRLLEKGGKNTFLTRPDKGRTFDVRRALREDAEIIPDAEPGEAGDPFAYPYPVGREREAIFRAFDNVFSTLKWETTEQGTRLYQPPMFKNSARTLAEFIDKVEKNPKIKQTYLRYKTKKGIEIDILSDLLKHDEAHVLSISDYEDIFENIDNVSEYFLSNRSKYCGIPYLLKIVSKKRIYGVAVEIFPHRTIVSTVFKTTDNGYKNWCITETNNYQKKQKRAAQTPAPSQTKGYTTSGLGQALPKKGKDVFLGQLIDSIAERLKNINSGSSQTLHQSAKSNLPETIEIDGEKKSTRNSEGRPIAATEEGIRNFYKWFGNSKVVDKDGRPLVVYHGGGNDIKIFDYSKIGQQGRSEGSGFEFTANKDLAQGYADRHGGGLYPVYLRIERPILDLDQTTLSDEQKYNFLELFNDKVNQDEEYVSEMGEDSVLSDYGSIDGALSAVQYDKDLDVVNEFINSTHRNKEILEAFAEVAYDGVILTNGSEWHSNGLYVVFNNNQIKSTDNTGTFDPGNPNIYYQPSETQKGIAEGEKYRGKTEWFRDSARTIITLFRSADASTLPHELAHVFMLDLQRMAKLNPDGRLGQILKDLKETVGEPQGEVAGEYSVEQQEKFARLFERYIAEGYAPDKGWRRLFAIFKDWLRSIYRTFKDFPELSPAAKDLFDRWLSFDDASNIPGMETLKEYRGRINALKAVAEAAKDNRDIEEDGITAQDLKAVLNVTRMDRPEDAEAQKAYNEALAIADEITESQAEANGLLEKIEDMEHRGARQFDSRDVAMFDDAIERIEAIQAGKDTESGGTSFYQGGKEDANKFILPEALGRANERIEPVAIKRHFADRKESREISIDDVTKVLLSSVEKNDNGFNVLRHSSGLTVTLSNNAIGEMFHNTSKRNNLNIGGIVGKEVIANLPSVFKNSVFIAETPDLKRHTKNSFLYFGNVIKSGNDSFIVKITVKKLDNKRAFLTAIELERNAGIDLSAYDVKVTNKKTLAGNMSVHSKSTAFRKGTDYIVADLIDFIKFDLEKYLNKNASGSQTLYQSAKNAGDKDLIAVHAARAENIDDILKEGVLVAPSLSITKKGQKELNRGRFGDIAFVARPDSISYVKWNIYNRDIYSPRFPQPVYLTDGFGYITQNEYDNYKRKWEENPEEFKKNYGGTFEDVIGNDKYIFEGFNERTGKRIYKKYNSKNLLSYLKKEKLLGGETFSYGLSSFLAKMSVKIKNRKQLREESKRLKDRQEADGKYEELRKRYADYFGDINKYSRFQEVDNTDFDDFLKWNYEGQPEKADEFLRVEDIPDYLKKELKDFTQEALSLPASYFEAKPMALLPLEDFAYAITKKGTLTAEQKKQIQAKGIEVIETEKGAADFDFSTLVKRGNSFFQSSKEPDRFRREDYAYGFRPEKDPEAAIRKINAVIEDLIKEVEKRKGDEETKARVIKTLRSAIGYKGYLARVRQARSIIDEAQRRMSDQKLPFKEQQTLTPEKRAEIIKVRTDPEKQKEIDRKAGRSEHENWDRAKEYARDLGRSVSDRAAGISPKLKLAFREFTRKFNLERTAHSKALEPFIKAYRAMSEDDRAIFDWAAFNGDTKTIEEYKQKYKDLAPALETYRQVLDDIYMKAAEAGFDVGYIQDYFPRKVKDYTAFKTFLKGTKEWTFIEEYLKKELNIKDPDKWMTDGQHDDVLADIINRYMRGTGIEGRGNGKPGNIKKRRIIEITPEQMHFYYGLDESILMYAASMDKAIQARKIFGYDLLHEEDTVGMIVKDIVEERKAAHAKNPEIPLLTHEDEEELKKDIVAFLHPKGPDKYFQAAKDWGYMLTLVSPISTITQLEDLSVAIVENGAGRTVSAAFETARKKGKKIALEDIGVEQYDIDINSGRMSQKILGKALKATGFSAFDRFGKETFILSDFNKRVEQVRGSKKGRADFIAECEMYGYEPERIKNMVECFMKGDINDLNDDAKSLLFYDLAEVQPIDLAEMPVGYLRGGNCRIAYALKTFTLKRLNYLITKTQRLAKKGQILWDNGDKAGAMAEWAKGTGIMTWTLFLLVAAGASMDWLKDLILRRQSDVPSLLVDNLLKQASFNRWEVKRVAQEGITDIFIAKITPPVLVTAVDFRRDTVRIAEGKLSVKDMKIWNQFPVIGRFYYWWLGGGKLITEKQKEKEARKKRAKKRRQKQRRRE